MEYQLFNLEKIRELTSPVENLQSKVNQVTNLINQFESEKLNIPEYHERDYKINQLKDVASLLERISKNFKDILTNNINEFLKFKHKLTNKHKSDLKNNLKNIDFSTKHTIAIGQSLIEERSISKIITQISYTSSISVKQWLELIDALNQNTIFLSSAEELQKSFLRLVKKRLDYELKKIPISTPSSIIEEFKRHFNLSHDITFQKFLKTIENRLTEEELQVKKELLTKSKQKQEIEELKKKQEEQSESYESYLKLSEKEFERSLRKRKREKLIDVKESKKKKKLELTEEVTEKIEKFKMKFDKKIDENYLNKEDIDVDPIKLIRDRKEKKDKEYKKFKDHFESD